MGTEITKAMIKDLAGAGSLDLSIRLDRSPERGADLSPDVARIVRHARNNAGELYDAAVYMVESRVTSYKPGGAGRDGEIKCGYAHSPDLSFLALCRPGDTLMLRWIEDNNCPAWTDVGFTGDDLYADVYRRGERLASIAVQHYVGSGESTARIVRRY